MESESMPGGKRDNPNYSQVSGHVPKDLKRKFEIYCVMQDMTLSDGLELALNRLIEEDRQDKKD